MNLFRRATPARMELTTAPEPPPQDPLTAAETEEAVASRACSAASQRCVDLDEESRTWEARRTMAYTAFVDALAWHKEARERLAVLKGAIHNVQN